jgi:hypothetical protein
LVSSFFAAADLCAQHDLPPDLVAHCFFSAALHSFFLSMLSLVGIFS